MAMLASKRKHAGFSLVELMVGMVLGLMLIAGAVSIYLATSQSYREVEQVAALSENARFAEQILGDSLRHAGFIGEVPASRVELDSNLTPLAAGEDCATPAEAGAYDLSRLGYAATVDSSGNALGCIDDAYVLPVGTGANDVLVIKHSIARPYSDGERWTGDPNNPPVQDGTINIPGPLETTKVYVMTNDVRGLMFDGGDTPPTITTGGEIPGGTAWEYAYEVFYVRDDGPIPQLARKYLDGSSGAMKLETENIVEGVERMHLLFGYDSDNDGEVDRYSDLAAIGSNWDGIESIEIFMLVRSATPDAQYVDNKTYTLGNLTVNATNDNFRRLVSHTSISLRNLKLMLRGGA